MKTSNAGWSDVMKVSRTNENFLLKIYKLQRKMVLMSTMTREVVGTDNVGAKEGLVRIVVKQVLYMSFSAPSKSVYSSIVSALSTGTIDLVRCTTNDEVFV